MHRFKKTVAAAMVAGFAALITSCATGPSASKAPAWTMDTPAPDATYTYFVGYADGAPGAVAQTTDAATASMVAEIMRYIGVTITAESSATAKATLDSFQADIVQTVKQTSTSRMAGFTVAKKFTAQRKDGLTVFILGRFETKALEAERKRIAAVFQEKIDAVAKPEAEGKELLSAGDLIGAARKFIEAAVAASGSDIENSAIKFERNLNAAKEAVARLTFEKVNDKLQANPGAAFAEPFKAVARAGGRGVSGVPVTISYQTKLPNGRLSTRNVNQVSAGDGSISFTHPAPDFVGKATLTVRLDLSSAVEPLYAVPAKFKSMVAGLDDEISNKRVAFEYTVVSAARSIPTAVLIADVDQSGAATVGTTSSALLSALAGNGFNVTAASLPADSVAGKDDPSVLAAAKAALAGRSARFAYGTTRVVSVRADGTQKIATVSAEVKVVDLESGRVLYSAVKQASTVASSDAQAIEAARRQLGQKTIGDDMGASLP